MTSSNAGDWYSRITNFFGTYYSELEVAHPPEDVVDAVSNEITSEPSFWPFQIEKGEFVHKELWKVIIDENQLDASFLRILQQTSKLFDSLVKEFYLMLSPGKELYRYFFGCLEATRYTPISVRNCPELLQSNNRKILYIDADLIIPFDETQPPSSPEEFEKQFDFIFDHSAISYLGINCSKTLYYSEKSYQSHINLDEPVSCVSLKNCLSSVMHSLTRLTLYKFSNVFSNVKFADAIEKNDSLKILELINCDEYFFERNSTDQNKILLLAIAKNQSIQKLKMTKCYFTWMWSRDTMRNVACTIPSIILYLNEANNISLTHLSIRFAHIHMHDKGLEDCEKMSDALATNTSLTYLDLGYNYIDIVGFNRFSEALAKNTTLKALNLVGNEISRRGIKVEGDKRIIFEEKAPDFD